MPTATIPRLLPPEALDAAKAKADAIVAAYSKADSELEGEEKLNAALTEAGIDGTANAVSSISGSSISVAADWLKDASRKVGDITAEVNSGETGYNVVVFLSRDDNHYNTVSVRHILIKAEESADGTYHRRGQGRSQGARRGDPCRVQLRR